MLMGAYWVFVSEETEINSDSNEKKRGKWQEVLFFLCLLHLNLIRICYIIAISFYFRFIRGEKNRFSHRKLYLFYKESSQMRFDEFIVVDSINPNLQATTKEDAIREMASSLVKAGKLPEDDYESLVRAIIKREELGSTGIGRGIAVPHTKHPCVKELVGTVAVSNKGVEFDSLDGEPVYVLFLLISPPNEPARHLRALELIARQLRNDTFCKFLKQARNCEDILQLITEADNNQFE